MTTRIDTRFAETEGRRPAGAGDVFMAATRITRRFAEDHAGAAGAGSDVIELGMPFSDPMADGPAIQASGQRALKGGQSLKKTLSLASDFRKGDNETPIVLMGYYNPIYIYGVERFLADANKAGIDGLIVVDLPPENGRGTVPAGAQGRHQLHPACHPDHGRQAVADWCSPTRRVSSTMFR
jgi:tryptophan synthase alpha chain